MTDEVPLIDLKRNRKQLYATYSLSVATCDIFSQYNMFDYKDSEGYICHLGYMLCCIVMSLSDLRNHLISNLTTCNVMFAVSVVLF
jgi:hypothetical protein